MTDYKKMYEDLVNKINDDQMNLPPIAHTIDKLNQEYDNLDNEYNNMKIKYNKIKIINQTNIKKSKALETERNCIISSLITTHLEECYGEETDITFYIKLPFLNSYRQYNNTFNCNVQFIQSLMHNCIIEADDDLNRYDNISYSVIQFDDNKPEYEIMLSYE